MVAFTQSSHSLHRYCARMQEQLPGEQILNQRTSDALTAAAGGQAPADSPPSTPVPSYIQEINCSPKDTQAPNTCYISLLW